MDALDILCSAPEENMSHLRNCLNWKEGVPKSFDLGHCVRVRFYGDGAETFHVKTSWNGFLEKASPAAPVRLRHPVMSRIKGEDTSVI